MMVTNHLGVRDDPLSTARTTRIMMVTNHLGVRDDPSNHSSTSGASVGSKHSDKSAKATPSVREVA